jgi:two-component system CheB/CheR fusion protein
VRLFFTRGRAPIALSQAAPRGLLAGCHILVVDDDDELRLMLRTALEVEGARVSEADRAKRAVEVAGLTACDVVITDITMGHTRRDGVWLLDRFRASAGLTKIPVVAVTGCKELQSELTARGFDRVLIKPIDVLDLPRTILRLLRGSDPAAAVAVHRAA